jgi:hypothetical protein
VSTAALNFTVSLSRGLAHESDLRLCTFLPVIYHIGDEIFPFATLLAGGTVTVLKYELRAAHTDLYA